MKTRTRVFLSLCMISAIVSITFSQKVASTSLQFLKVMPCARATALGDAYSVWATGAEAVFWNPSGVALTEKFDISTTFIKWIFDSKQAAISYAMHLGDFGALGLQLQYVDYGTFEETVLSLPYIKELPDPGFTGKTFQPYSYVAGITYAKSLTEKFSMGVTFKYAYESLYDGSNVVFTDSNGTSSYKTYTGAYLFDFGIRYNTGFRSIQIGAAIQNFGPDFVYAIEKQRAPMSFRVGAAADVLGPDGLLFTSENQRLGIAFDLFQPNDYDQQEHVGMEYEFAKSLALRIGYKYNYDSEGLTFGCGLHLTISEMNIRLDYSYGSLGTYLGNTHRISLGVEPK
ncbi:MAG: PorV/PorQ family protein [Bacteroidota bacterium]